jgi:inorganic triphosphatase YgiF
MARDVSSPLPAQPDELKRDRAREVEVKLECPPDLLASLFNLELLASAIVRPRAQRLVATYFDTPDDALNRAGMSLRLRKSGAQRVMTLKWALQGSNGFSRGEAEAPFPGDQPDVDVFGPEISKRVREAARGETLAPRFETRVRRRTAELSLGASLVEIALDEGEIVAAEARRAISECELELKKGEPAALFGLAAQLTDAGLSVNPVSKARRGFLLARREKPIEVRAVAPLLDAKASIEDAMSAVIQNALIQFIENWPALFEGDLPESVHQMRVALRRLRAALALFERAFPGAGFERFRDDAKRLANALGPARDLDVFIALVSEGPLAVFASEPSFEVLLSASRARRRDAYRAAKEAIGAPETSRFVLELQAFVASRGWRNALGTEELPSLGRSARSLADGAIERLYRRARKLGKDMMAAEPAQRHRLRIVLKNIRYASEFFGSLYDAAGVGKFIKVVGALQDALGAHNDSVSALKLVEDATMPAESKATGIVLGWCAREINSPESSLRDQWQAFKKARCFWR